MVTLIFNILILYVEIESIFYIVPWTAEEMYGYMEYMDMTTSSCIVLI